MPVNQFSLKNSIATKLFKIVFLFYFSVTVVLTGIQMGTEYNYVKNEVLRELQLLATAIKPGLSGSLWEMDISQVRSTISVLSKLPIITGIKIEDESGNLLEARGMVFIPRGEPLPATESSEFEIAAQRDTSDIFSYDFEIVYTRTNEMVGKVTLYSNRGVIFDRVEYGFMLILINALLKTISLWAIFLIVSRYILRYPLQHLIKMTQQINLDNLEHLQVNIRRKGNDELKIFEETLNAMIQKLITARKRIKAYTEELEEKNKQLKQMDRLKDEFLVNTSHELRTPLHGIIGITESLQDHLVTNPSPFVHSNLSMIAISGRRLANLVNDILDFSQLKHQTLQLHQQSIDIQQIAEVVLRLSTSVLHNSDLTVVNHISADLPPVYADENRLQQILHNLLTNAFKFSTAGEIVIDAGVRDKFMEISISNPGNPIPPDKQATIFHSFEQIDGSISRQYGGAGLGLAITKQLVELHGGTIHVHSTEIGNVFTFTLPFSYENSILVTLQESLQISPLPSTVVCPEPKGPPSQDVLFTILVVDDDVTNLQVVMNYLVHHNFACICVQSAMEALGWMETHGSPDLILLDIMMPQMNGFEMCQVVRKTHTIGELPIIFLTASHRKNDRKTGFALGANDYLTKPFEKTELLARISAHLQTLKARDQLVALRECANRIATFKEHEQVLEFAVQKMMETRIASDSVWFKEEHVIRSAQEGTFFLNHSPGASLLETIKAQDASEIVLANDLRPESPLWAFYNQFSVDLEGCHLGYLQPKSIQGSLICLYRTKERDPFNELDAVFIQSMLEQIQTIESNIRTMLSDSLVQALPEVQPHLAQITHISASAPYCHVYVENEPDPREIRIPLSTLDLYFSDGDLLKVHRSHLINPDKIVRIQKTQARKRNYQYDVLVGNKNEFYTIRIGDHFVAKLMTSFPHFFEESAEVN